MVYIYVLKLEYNKYYVGKTISPINRVGGHFDLNGSAWTKKFKPIDIVEIIPNCDELDEDKYTLKYMKEKGIHNVRGGTFCNITLSKTDVITIKKMIDFSSDKCYICGKTGHFAKNCTEEYDKILDLIFTNMVEKDLAESQVNNIQQENQQDRIQQENQQNIIKCLRCGRFGHTIEKCFSKTTIDGKSLLDKKIFDGKKKSNKFVKKNIDKQESKSELETDIDNIQKLDSNTLQKINKEVLIHPCEFCTKKFNTINGKNYHMRFYCKFKPQNEQDVESKVQDTESKEQFQVINKNENTEKSTTIPFVKIVNESIALGSEANSDTGVSVGSEIQSNNIESGPDTKIDSDKPCDCFGSFLSPHPKSKCKVNNQIKRIFNFF